MATLLSYALCSVSDVQALLTAAGVTADNDLATRKINSTTEMIERYCGRRFISTAYTNEEYDSTRSDQLILIQRPVTSLTSFQVRDTTLNENDWETVESTLYFLDSTAGVLDLNFLMFGKWNRARITYVAGYSTIPADLAEACASLAAYYVKYPDGNVNVQEKQEGGRRIRYFQGITGTRNLFQQLGIDSVIDSYANEPILADK